MIDVDEENEWKNKMRVADYFKLLREVDSYIANKDKLQITYKQAPKTSDNKEQPCGTVNIKMSPNKTAQSDLQVIRRRKNIVIEDQVKSLMSWEYAKCLSTPKPDSILFQGSQCKSVLTCRNPFKADPNLINYDLDSEDEWAEENGEDLQDADCQKYSDDDEDDLAEQEAAEGFIVDDDYLSVSEMNYSMHSNDDVQLQADLERRKVILQKNREGKKLFKEQVAAEAPRIFYFKRGETQTLEYTAVSFISVVTPGLLWPNREFPICPRSRK